MKILKIYSIFVIVCLIVGINNSFNHKIDDLSFDSGICETETIEDMIVEEENDAENKVVKEIDETGEIAITENKNKTTNNNKTNENISSEGNVEKKNEVLNVENHNSESKQTNSEVKQDNTISQETKTNNQTNNGSDNHENNKKKDDDPVDTRNLDYSIHRGRVDCKDIDECMNISLPFQYKFKKSIINSFYIEVITVKDNTLGYFIEYVFKDGNYKTKDECEKVGKQMTDELSDKITSFSCDSSGILKINANY